MGHKTNGVAVTVNICQCMQYVIGNTNAVDILQDTFITEHKDLLYHGRCRAEPAVDVFNSETWGTIDYSPLQKMIVSNKIAIHRAQNQGVESIVFSTQIAGRTNCGRALKSVRVFLNTWIIRPFNKKSLEMKREHVLAMQLEDDSTIREPDQQQITRARSKEVTCGRSESSKNQGLRTHCWFL